MSIKLPFPVANKWLRIFLLVIVVGWMAAYPIYTSYYKANAVEQYERFQAHMAGNSMFFNPWQYRILCPLLIEGIYQTLDHTLFRVIEIKGIHLSLPGDNSDKNNVTQKLVKLLADPQFVKYTLVFVGFRFFQDVLVLWLLYVYLSSFVKNETLIWLALIMLTLFLGNSVVDSDLTFNTYMDITVYLCAALVIVRHLSGWWIVPITVIGALNRETSILIPALYFCAKADWKQWPGIGRILFGNAQSLFITGLSYVLFLIIFVSIRSYYGYAPASTWRMAPGIPMLKMNMFSPVSVKSYMELFGVFAFLPLWSLLIFRRMQYNLQIFFIVIVPVWFVVHLSSAIAYQTRLFLVPTVLVFIPAVLAYVEQEVSRRAIASGIAERS